MIEKFLKDCKEASKKIYTLIQNGLSDSYLEYTTIGAGGDRSLKIDLYAEKIFCDYLKKYGKIVSEESGILGEGENEIILDPIDGSDNLFSGFPYYGASIALKKDGKTFFSFIVNFANGDFFIKSENFYKKGSLLYEGLKDVRIVKRGKIGLFEKAYANPELVKYFKEANIKFRTPGAVALSLAYAHNVEFVLFAGEIREYDIAAGLHQCEDLNLFYNKDYILVSKNVELFDKIKGILFKG